MKKILSINNLSKIYHNEKYEIKAIDNISFDVYENDFIAIVGPSGCGKSTLLSILCGIDNKSNGTIEFDNIKVGYMLQQDALFEFRDVLSNCLLGLEVTNNLNEETKKNVLRLLKEYGLKDFIHKYPKDLSGGMRQRVALIRTLATNPDILLLDEPFSALDYQTRLSVSDDVYKIIEKEKKTAIIVTHDLSEAISMARKIIILTKRPASIKNIIDIDLTIKDSPISNRNSNNFAKYYDYIWKEIDHDE